jgi:peptide/nickel transport system substrate-binding protein
MNLFRRSILALAVVAGASLTAPGTALAQDKVLRVVPHSNLAILDPIWTTPT